MRNKSDTISDIMRKKTLMKIKIAGYENFVSGLQKLFEEARHRAARSVNAILTATYWEVGRRIASQIG